MWHVRTQEHQSRYNWFSYKIGQTIFRNKVSCDCTMCTNSYANGVKIEDADHASYLHDCENELGCRYFDTKEQRDEYEFRNK